MRYSGLEDNAYRKPQLLEKAEELDSHLKKLSVQQIASCMDISSSLAEKTRELIASWSTMPERQSLAIDSFLGDIYSGLHANDLSKSDRDYADKSLRILSGLYGILRPYDGICPYRLEMGYRLPNKTYADLYKFWGTNIATTLPAKELIINLAAVEYSRTITPYVDPALVIAPYFMTKDPKTGKPSFVVVHAKIARGAFARWVIIKRIQNFNDLTQFNELGYSYDQKLSTKDKPVFVCEEFGGKGRSIRLIK